jgi:GT2 family glycosyltransferase
LASPPVISAVSPTTRGPGVNAIRAPDPRGTARGRSAHGGPTVSIIVPVRRDAPSFRQCLASLRAAEPPPDELIIVVDGGDRQLARVARRHAGRVLTTSRAQGPAAARNLAAREAAGDVLLFTDADVAVHADVVARVREALGAEPGASAVIGSYDDCPPAPNLLSQYKNLLQHYVHQNARPEGCTFWGACGAVRRDAFLSCGGFDERYRAPAIEDIELGYRLRASGHRIHVCKDLRVTHLKRWTARSLFWSDFFRRALPWSDLILRSGRMDDDLNIDRRNRLKVALAGVFTAALLFAVWRPAALAVAAGAAATVLVLDAPLAAFFCRKRGPLFASGAMLWHLFFYVYGGLAFGLALAAYFVRAFGKALRPATRAAAPADGGITR